MAAPTTKTSPAPVAAAASPAASVHAGYPSLLPASMAVPPSRDPFWFDGADPTQLWDAHLSTATGCKTLAPLQLFSAEQTAADPVKCPPLPPKPAGHLRFCAISDTHNFHNGLPLHPPPSGADIDVLVHGGDFSNVGEQRDVEEFTQWIRALPIKYKIVIGQ